MWIWPMRFQWSHARLRIPTCALRRMGAVRMLVSLPPAIGTMSEHWSCHLWGMVNSRVTRVRLNCHVNARLLTFRCATCHSGLPVLVIVPMLRVWSTVSHGPTLSRNTNTTYLVEQEISSSTTTCFPTIRHGAKTYANKDWCIEDFLISLLLNKSRHRQTQPHCDVCRNGR